MFVDCVSLVELQLNNNELQVIPSGTFNGLRKVKSLVLNSNRITTLAPGLFDDCVSLELLNLASNAIKLLPSSFLAQSRVHSPALNNIILRGNVLSCPTPDVGGAGRATVLMSECSCAVTEDADVRYRLERDNGNLHCETSFLPGSGQCAAAPQQAQDESCTEGVCRHHCCAAGTPRDCPACGSVIGDCYRPVSPIAPPPLYFANKVA